MTTPRHLDRIPFWIGCILLALSSALATAQTDQPASAKTEPSSQDNQEEPDTLILSDTLNYNDETKESTFTGNVIMTRGLLTLRADTLIVREDAEGFQHGDATVSGSGKRVKFRQENPESFEVIEAEGLRGIYNGKTDEIEMIGQAIVVRYVCGKPLDTIRGERVKYNQTTSVYQAFAGPQSSDRGGRVRSLATPSSKADAAIEACRQKSKQG